MAETDGDANPAASSGAVAEDDRDAAFLEAARSAAAASLEKRRAHLRAREARARSATVAARAPNLGSIDESRVVNGDGRTDTIAGASNGGVARKVVARASDGVDRLAGTPASHRHGDENGNARDDENANETALGDDVSPALVRGREGARAVVDGSDPIGVTAVFIETDRVAAGGAAGAFETIFCGYADGSIRRFHRPAPAPENVGNARGKTTRAGWTELDAVHAPEPWNDAAGSVRIIKRVGSGRAGKAGDDEGGGGRLFAAFDNGSWVRFEMTRGKWRLVEIPVLGPHPNFADAFRLRPRLRGNKWLSKRARCLSMCHVDTRDGTDGVLYLSSPVHGEHCVYRWEIPRAVCDVVKEAEAKAEAEARVEPPCTPERNDVTGDNPEPNNPEPNTPEPNTPEQNSETDERAAWERFKLDVWGVATKMDRHADAVAAIAPFPALGPDAVVTGGNDGLVCVWSNVLNTRVGGETGDAHDAPLYPACAVNAAAAVRAIAVAPDAASVFSAGADRNVQAWSVHRKHRKGHGADVRLVYTRSFAGGHEGFVTALAVLPRGSLGRGAAAAARCDFLLSGSEGGTKGDLFVPGDGGVKVWRVADGSCAQTADTMRREGTCEALVVRTDSGGTVIGVLRGGGDGAVVEWDVEWGAWSGNRRDFPRGFLTQ